LSFHSQLWSGGTARNTQPITQITVFRVFKTLHKFKYIYVTTGYTVLVGSTIDQLNNGRNRNLIGSSCPLATHIGT
jgi:hypothetical protein